MIQRGKYLVKTNRAVYHDVPDIFARVLASRLVNAFQQWMNYDILFTLYILPLFLWLLSEARPLSFPVRQDVRYVVRLCPIQEISKAIVPPATSTQVSI